MMPWSRKLSAPITLDDGRVFETLRHAARFMLELPELNQRNPHWQSAGDAMMRAATKSSQADLAIAEEKLKAALQAEGALNRVRR